MYRKVRSSLHMAKGSNFLLTVKTSAYSNRLFQEKYHISGNSTDIGRFDLIDGGA